MYNPHSQKQQLKESAVQPSGQTDKQRPKDNRNCLPLPLPRFSYKRWSQEKTRGVQGIRAHLPSPCQHGSDWHTEDISTEHVSSRFSAWRDGKALWAGWEGNQSWQAAWGTFQGVIWQSLRLFCFPHSKGLESRARTQPKSPLAISSNEPREDDVPSWGGTQQLIQSVKHRDALTSLLVRHRWGWGITEDRNRKPGWLGMAL